MDATPKDSKSAAKLLAFAALLLGILLYYFSMAFQGRLTPPPVVENVWGRVKDSTFAPAPANRYYAQLSEALLVGKLHFLDEPRRQLLELNDVYSPSQNYPWRRFHDASLYKGHWYIYFGITPALLLGIPAQICGMPLRDDVAVSIFCWLGLLASLGLLRAIVRRSDLKPSSLMWVASTFCLALCAAQPFMLARCQVYEVAISSNYFCIFTALYLLFTGFFCERIVPWRLALGSLFMALAVGSRPNSIMHGWILVGISLLLYRRRQQFSQNTQLAYYAALWIPCLAFGYCLGLYNYLRFDSWTDFGFKYALTGFDMRELKMFKAEYVLPNTYFYLFQPLTLDAIFPFFHVHAKYPGTLPTPYYLDHIAGILWLAPIVLILPLFPVINKMVRGTQANGTALSVAVLSAVVLTTTSLFQLMLLILAFPYSMLRYTVDFAPFLVLASVLIWLHLHTRFSNENRPTARRWLNIIVAVAIVGGSVQGLAIGMSGENEYFKTYNPAGFEKIRGAFNFIERRPNVTPP